MLVTLAFPKKNAPREPWAVELSRVPVVGEALLDGEVYFSVRMVVHIVNPYPGDSVAIVTVD